MSISQNGLIETFEIIQESFNIILQENKRMWNVISSCQDRIAKLEEEVKKLKDPITADSPLRTSSSAIFGSASLDDPFFFDL